MARANGRITELTEMGLAGVRLLHGIPYFHHSLTLEAAVPSSSGVNASRTGRTAEREVPRPALNGCVRRDSDVGQRRAACHTGLSGIP